MSRYRHTQAGWTMLAISLVPVLIVVTVLGRSDNPLLLVLPLAIVIPVLAVFGWLTVTIDDRELTARFGFSPARKRIPLESIASFAAVRSRWYHGWGVRYTPGRGWLYNVSGLDAVEFVLHDGTRVRIGTDEPDEVVRALSRAVAERRESVAASETGTGVPVQLVLVGMMLVPVAFVVVLLFVLGTREAVVTVSADQVVVESWWLDIESPMDEIAGVSLEETLPRVRRRTNGFSVGATRRGRFRLAELGDGLLFVQADTPPFVFIDTADSYLLVNFGDPDRTRQLYAQLVDAWPRVVRSR